MKAPLQVGLFASALAFAASTASASATGLDVGARVGYGIPFGNLEYSATDSNRDEPLNDFVTGQVPIWIDLGYRLIRSVLVGAYFQYGFAFVKDCPSGVNCSAHDTRLGLQAQRRFLPGEPIDPWVGFGIGYEWLGASQRVGGRETDISFDGFEFANFQAGLDFATVAGLSVGPFASLSLGEYSHISVAPPDLGSGGGDIARKDIHEWLVLGVKAAFDP